MYYASLIYFMDYTEGRIISVNEKYSELNEKLSKVSEDFSLVRTVSFFSNKNNLETFFDSKDYFFYVNNFSKAENFFVREKEFSERDRFSENFKREKVFYFDFFLNLDFNNQKIPIYLREKDFFENKRNILYSDFYSHKERDHQIYWTHLDEEWVVKHPVNSEKIISYYENKKLNSILLKKLQKNLLEVRAKNPEKNDSKRRTIL